MPNRGEKDNYEDILGAKRPESKHPKMPQKQRAKQFSPFEALGALDEGDEEKTEVK